MKCVGIVTASIEKALAFLYDFVGIGATYLHSRRNGDDKLGFPRKVLKEVNNHNHLVYVCNKYHYPLLPRDFLMRGVWAKIREDQFLLCYESIDEPEKEKDLPLGYATSNRETVRATHVKLIFHIERISDSQSKITHFSRMDTKSAVGNNNWEAQGDIVKEMSDYFERDDEMDSITRHEFIVQLPYSMPLSDEESGMLQRCMKFGNLQKIGGKVFEYNEDKGLNPKKESKHRWRKLKPAVSHFNSIQLYIKYAEGDSDCWKKAVGVVHASQEEVLASLWDFASNRSLKEHYKKQGNLPRLVFDIPGKRSRIFLSRSRAGPVAVSESLFKGVWAKYRHQNGDDHLYCMAFEPIKSKKRKQKERSQKERSFPEGKRKTAKRSLPFPSRNSSKSSVQVADASNVTPERIREMVSRSLEGKNDLLPEAGATDGAGNTPSAVDNIPTFLLPIDLKGVYVLRRLANDICEMTVVQHSVVDDHRMLSRALVTESNNALAIVQHNQNLFLRNGQYVDAEMRFEFMRNIAPKASVSKEQLDFVNSLARRFLYDVLPHNGTLTQTAKIMGGVFQRDQKGRHSGGEEDDDIEIDSEDEHSGEEEEVSDRSAPGDNVDSFRSQDSVEESPNFTSSLDGRIHWIKLKTGNSFIHKWYTYSLTDDRKSRKSKRRREVLQLKVASTSAEVNENCTWTKSVTVIDTTAMEVLAYSWDFCSCHNMRVHYADENLCREVSEKIDVNEINVEEVMRLPWPRRPRRFTSKVVWRKITHNLYCLVVKPLKNRACEKSTENYVAGFFTACIFFENIADDFRLGKKGIRRLSRETINLKCRVSVFQRVDFNLGGKVKVDNIKPRFQFISLPSVRKEFNRDREVDTTDRTAMAWVIMNTPQEYSKEEDTMLIKVKKAMDTSRMPMQTLSSYDSKVSLKVSRNRKYFRMTTVIDASIAECVAYEFMKLSRVRGAQYSDAGDLDQEFIKKNDHSDLFRVIKCIKGGVGVHMRELYCHCIWKKFDENYIVVAYDNINSAELFRSSNISKGYYSSYVECRRLSPVGGYEQTEVINTFKYSVSGFIPKTAFEEHLTISYVLPLSRMRETFQKDVEISQEKRKQIRTKFEGVLANRTHEKDENKALGESMQMFKIFHRNLKTKISTDNPLIQGETCTVNGVVYCCLTGVMRAPASETLLFLWDVDGKHFRDDNVIMPADVLSPMLDTNRERDRFFTQTVHLVENGYRIISECERELLLDMTWTRSNNSEGYMCAYSKYIGTATKFIRRSTKARFNVGDYAGARTQKMSRRSTGFFALGGGRFKLREKEDIKALFKITNIDGHESSAEFIFVLGREDEFNDYFSIQKRLLGTFEYRTFASTQLNFQRTAALSKLTGGDGIKLGQTIMAGSKKTVGLRKISGKLKKRREEEVAGFFRSYSSMQEVSNCHPFFEPMIRSILTNEAGFVEEATKGLFSARGIPSDSKELRKGISTKLHVLTARDGEIVGRSFARILAHSANEEGAVETFLEEYPALKEFSQMHRFYRPMMREISKVLIAEVNFQKIFEAVRGSAFALFDFLTDVFTITYYYDQDDNEYWWYATSMIVSISSALCLQLTLVFFIHQFDKEWLRRELLATVTFMKPALNIFRVLTKTKVAGHEMLDQTTELVYFKACKLGLESIPCTVLQFVGLQKLFSAGESQEASYNIGVVVSLLITAAATSHTVMYMSYIKDITITNR